MDKSLKIVLGVIISCAVLLVSSQIYTGVQLQKALNNNERAGGSNGISTKYVKSAQATGTRVQISPSATSSRSNLVRGSASKGTGDITVPKIAEYLATTSLTAYTGNAESISIELVPLGSSSPNTLLVTVETSDDKLNWAGIRDFTETSVFTDTLASNTKQWVIPLNTVATTTIKLPPITGALGAWTRVNVGVAGGGATSSVHTTIVLQNRY